MNNLERFELEAREDRIRLAALAKSKAFFAIQKQAMKPTETIAPAGAGRRPGRNFEQMSVNLSIGMREKFKQLGGSQWLRELIDKEYDARK